MTQRLSGILSWAVRSRAWDVAISTGLKTESEKERWAWDRGVLADFLSTREGRF